MSNMYEKRATKRGDNMTETENDLKEIGRLMRGKAGELGWTQERVEKESGLSSSIINPLWNDQKTDIKLSSLRPLINALNLAIRISPDGVREIQPGREG